MGMKQGAFILENNCLCLRVENDVFYLRNKQNNRQMADMPYRRSLCLANGETLQADEDLYVSEERGCLRVTGRFGNAAAFEQVYWVEGQRLYERITLINSLNEPLLLSDVDFSMGKMLFTQSGGWCDNQDEYTLTGIPTRRYRSQRMDRLLDSYSAGDLLYFSPWSPVKTLKPGYMDEGWIWGEETGGLVICKYNPERIEYSRFARQGIKQPGRGRENVAVRFGGAAVFDGNPEDALYLERGASYNFGLTQYIVYSGGFEEGYYAYRAHLEASGHGLPPGYDPPMHWNELYNLGWFAEEGDDPFSDTQETRLYTVSDLYAEAEIAVKAGAQSLYLDPGWDLYPGSCVWDEQRLGKLKDFVDKIHREYELKVALHMMMTFASDREADDFYWRNERGETERWDFLGLYCVCTNETWVREKTKRLLALADAGVDFLMFDFSDFGGLAHTGCMCPHHGHEVPMRRMTHTENIMRVIRAVKDRAPHILIESHDRVVGGVNDYHPLYYQHVGVNRHDENWGYEFMWNPLADLLSGKALSLYEYNMAYPIPLYLHINMNSDNENLLSFWWYASVVRHLGIGGLTQADRRFVPMARAVRLYLIWKNYFTHGVFYGLSPCAHLHVCGGKGVLVLFNLKSRPMVMETYVDATRFGLLPGEVQAYDSRGGKAAVRQKGPGLTISAEIMEMSPLIVTIGIGGKDG